LTFLYVYFNSSEFNANIFLLIDLFAYILFLKYKTITNILILCAFYKVCMDETEIELAKLSLPNV
jgi:hypothetical protein